MSGNTRLFFVVVLAAASSLGCRHILNYPVDRAKDLIDVVGFDVYWGQGIIVHGQMTKMAQLGVGSFDGEILKCHRRAIGFVEEMRAEAGLPMYYFTIYDRRATMGNETFLAQHQQLTGLGEVHYNLTDPNDRGFYEVGVRVAFFTGIGVGIDIFQFLDFASGWIGVDFARDDARNSGRPRVENPRYRSTSETPVSEGLLSMSE